MKYLHTMIRVSDPGATVRFFELLQKGGHLPVEEPWASMENVGHW